MLCGQKYQLLSWLLSLKCDHSMLSAYKHIPPRDFVGRLIMSESTAADLIGRDHKLDYVTRRQLI